MITRRLKVTALLLLVSIGIGSGIFFLTKNGDNTVLKVQGSSLQQYRAGPFNIGIATDPETPRVGKNRLIFEIHDDDGDAFQGVQVDAYAEMPAMGAMPAMRAPANLTLVAAGRYEGEVDLSMRGEWPLTARITDASGRERTLLFELATDRPSLRLASGGSAVGDQAADGQDTPTITVDSYRRQLIGLETEQALHRALESTIRAVGQVSYDERRLSTVALKFDGYIGDLGADYVGASVQQGQVLFTVYSPGLLAAQQEYLEARKRLANRGPNDTLLAAAKQRLRLWDLSTSEIAALERRGTPSEYVPIHAPRTGTLVQKHIVSGSAAKAGDALLGIADLSQVWVEAEVYEADLALIAVDMTASVSLPYLPGQSFSARVEYVSPYLDKSSRTARIRLTLDNAAGKLRPDMYAEVRLSAPLGEPLSIPEEAIMVAGDSRIVFVDIGGGKLQPVYIKTGQRAEGYVEVLEGLSAGDQVVTSGNFLIAAETRLKTGIKQW